MPLRRSPVPSLPDPATRLNNPSIESPRITPRNSDGDQAVAPAEVKETPYGTLRQLANLPAKPSTPLRRASSAGPPSHRSLHRTPAGYARTPRITQRLGGSVRRPNILTPHGRAAVRELESRRAGLTPAKDRRRSGRQRETPRDILRALSRVLAPKTHPVVPTPQGALPAGRFILPGDADLEEDAALERPRLSLALEDEDEDDSLLLPPHSAGIEDENFTVRSVELPRRAISEQPGRLSRGSFGSIRMSDQFGDLTQGGVFDSSLAMGGPFDDDSPEMGDGPQEETVTLRDLGINRGRLSLTSGLDSDIRPLPFTEEDTDNTFVFTIPQRDVPEQQDEADDSGLLASRQLPGGREEPLFGVQDSNGSGNEGDGIDAEDSDQVEGFEVLMSESPKHVNVEMEMDVPDVSLQEPETSVLEAQKRSKRKIKVSKHGIQYPSLPAGVVKKLAITYARRSGNSKAKISKDALDAIMQASDWFFEQVSDDLGAYSKHAGRKTIDESDVVTLMRRQRQTTTNITPFSLAERHLPRELLQELRMVPPPDLKTRRRLGTVKEVDEEVDED